VPLITHIEDPVMQRITALLFDRRNAKRKSKRAKPAERFMN